MATDQPSIRMFLSTDNLIFNNRERILNTLTSFPVDITATTGNLWTSTSVTPTVARRPISDGPMWVPFASTHSPRLMSWPIGLCWESRIVILVAVILGKGKALIGSSLDRNRPGVNTIKLWPDVLSWTSLHQNPHLQLLRALKRTSKVKRHLVQDWTATSAVWVWLLPFFANSLSLGGGPVDISWHFRCRSQVRLTSSDSRSSSVSSTWTTASAPQGMGAPVVTRITWPGITVWVGCTDTNGATLRRSFSSAHQESLPRMDSVKDGGMFCRTLRSCENPPD